MVTNPLNSISVALCTYNGEHFLKEQLKSIANQTCKPFELVVCDDVSSDASTAVIENLARETPFPVRLHKNEIRAGVASNFERAIRLASGDIISLCDQDDVWAPEKLALFHRAFENGADWVCCDAEVVDTELTPLGYTLWQSAHFSKKERIQAHHGNLFEVLLKHYIVAGSTLAFRAELRDRLLPIPADWHYDAWIAAVLAATSKGVIIETPLQRYRQHSSNTIGGIRRGVVTDAKAIFALDRRNYYQDEISKWSQLSERLKSIEAPSRCQARLTEKVTHIKNRAGWPTKRIMRLPHILTEITRGGYSRFARNWGSIAIDLLLK